MKKLVKKSINVEVGTLDCNGVSAEGVIEQLQSFIDKYGDGIVTIHREPVPYSDNDYFGIFVRREETDEECKKRTILDDVDKLRLEECEKNMFEELQKKFGNKY